MTDDSDTSDDQFAESEDSVIGVCWYCGAKLRDGYDYGVVCQECLERRRADPQGDECSF
jgi:hypothetical protein